MSGLHISMGGADGKPALIRVLCPCADVVATFRATGELKATAPLSVEIECKRCGEQGIVLVGADDAAISSLGNIEADVRNFGVFQ